MMNGQKIAIQNFQTNSHPVAILLSVLVICHKLVLKSVSYPKIVKNTPILIEQSIACNVYTKHP